ncbi:hypothetical protein P4S55_11825 [Shewanella sp. PP-Sp27a-2]
MSEIAYLNGWKSKLCIELDTEDNKKADFNRFMVKHFPSTEVLKKGMQFEDAARTGVILQLKARFDEAIQEGASHASLYNFFFGTSLYLRWCDEQNMTAFTQPSLEKYMNHLDNRVMLGSMKNSTYTQRLSIITVVFTQYLELPYHYFDNVVVRDKSDTQSFESYTKNDKKQLLPFLRALFKQTYQQFMVNPEKHINANRCKKTMTFQWKNKEYQLSGGISKMMCAGTYLLSYYTYANTSDLFQLKLPEKASTNVGEIWYTMPAFKRRAFKSIRIEMGGHGLDIPKYSLDFFDKLLDASKLISDDENSTLLQTASSKKVRRMKSTTLNTFLRLWVEKHFSFTDQTGRKLRPLVSRFRESGAQITAYHQGELANDIMLNNTPNTRKKHYSEGNQITNNGMMQDTMMIREEQVKSAVNTEKAKENLGINVLVIEQEHKVDIPSLSRTPNGGSCAYPFGEKSKKYTKKAKTQGLLKEGEQLACADLLGCFGCPDQVIVQSVVDIWCLLSFKACIEESLYQHLDASHYRNNFENIIEFIDTKILPSIHTKIRKQAEAKLDDEGFHPTWDEPKSILHFIPKSHKESK